MTLPVKTHQMICKGMIDLNASNHRKRLGKKKKEYLVISAHECIFKPQFQDVVSIPLKFIQSILLSILHSSEPKVKRENNGKSTLNMHETILVLQNHQIFDA